MLMPEADGSNDKKVSFSAIWNVVGQPLLSQLPRFWTNRRQSGSYPRPAWRRSLGRVVAKPDKCLSSFRGGFHLYGFRVYQELVSQDPTRKGKNDVGHQFQVGSP